MSDFDELIQAAGRVARDRIAPFARHLDEIGWLEPVWNDLCELGVPGLCLPREYGGAGAPYSVYLSVTTEIARSSAVAALMPALNVLVSRALVRHGDEAVRARYLPALVSGEWKACWAFTEPATGSDPKAITTRAAPHPDGGWTLTGEKVFISHSGHADVAVVFAQHDGRLSAFIGRTENGFVAGPRERLLAFAGADTGAISLDGMRVHDLLGEPQGGFTVLLAGEAEAKLRASAICLGIAQRARDEAVHYAATRLHRGQPIGDRFQTIQWLLAECAARTEAIEALVERGGRATGTPVDVPALAARVKLMSSRLCREVVSDAVQVHGAYGFSKEFEVEMLYRQSKMYELVQGVSELNRVIIARDALAAAHV